MIFKAQFLGLDFQVCLGQSVDEEAIGVIPSKSRTEVMSTLTDAAVLATPPIRAHTYDRSLHVMVDMMNNFNFVTRADHKSHTVRHVTEYGDNLVGIFMMVHEFRLRNR
jgi:hypothetical protein